jgi:Acyl-CoA reductase (LuxC)
LSELSDVRVIWGGDETVRQIRKISIKPSAKEMAFVDRFSICLIDSNDFNEASEETKSELLRRFYNDCYGFDQLACSSPRLLVWRGKTQSCEKASQDFFKRLSSVVRAIGYTVSSSVALEKLSFLYGVAMTDRAQMVSRLSNEVMVARLSNLSDFDRQSCGAGFLYETSVESFLELEPFLSEKDQTLSYFASDRSELQKLPRAIRGRGIARIVPIGEALSFGRYWDGFDLLTEMTKWTVRWE